MLGGLIQIIDYRLSRVNRRDVPAERLYHEYFSQHKVALISPTLPPLTYLGCIPIDFRKSRAKIYSQRFVPVSLRPQGAQLHDLNTP